MADESNPGSMGPITNNKGIVTQNQQGNNTIINGPPRDENGIYQKDRKIGGAPAPTIDEAGGIVVFAMISLSAIPREGEPIEYGDFILEWIDMPPISPKAARVAAQGTPIAISYNGQFRCKIIGRR